MTPIDASKTNPFPDYDPVEMMRGLTMAFIITLSRTPNMLVEITKETYANFPYECYRLVSLTDEKTGSITFMLNREEDCEVAH